MSENDRKLLAEVIRYARLCATSSSELGCVDDCIGAEIDAKALQSAIDRYDLRAEDRIA